MLKDWQSEQLKALKEFYGDQDGQAMFDMVHAFDYRRTLRNRGKAMFACERTIPGREK